MTSFREHETDETSAASPAQFRVLVRLEPKLKHMFVCGFSSSQPLMDRSDVFVQIVSAKLMVTVIFIKLISRDIYIYITNFKMKYN